MKIIIPMSGMRDLFFIGYDAIGDYYQSLEEGIFKTYT
jgi:hypothetical protein